MNNTYKASKRPWKVTKIVLTPERTFAIESANGEVIAEVTDSNTRGVDKADASLIVKAVNNFEILIEALQSAKRVFESGNLETQDAEETALEIDAAINQAK